MASAIWDPDEVEAYLQSSPWDRLLEALLFGAMLGLILGAVLGLLQWLVLRRRPRDVLLFIVATVVGSALLCHTARIGPAELESNIVIMLRAGAVGGAIGGGFSGLVQWIILRRRMSRADGWTLLTAAAWAAGWAIAWVPLGLPFIDQHYIPGHIFFLAASLAGGAVAGLGQWLLLRHNVRLAGWWIPATAVSWGIAYLPVFGGVSMIAPGAVVGVITATTLVWLLSPGTT